jgi:predicted tellurium resistance membrane protein TerC
MSWIFEPEAWIALATLTAIEIVLGIDNIIFISILAGKLPEAERAKGRTLGLGLAMFVRIALLLSLTWIMRLTEPLFNLLGKEISGRDLILIGGGLFLLAKSTLEIHSSLEGEETRAGQAVAAGFAAVLAQILIMDIIFSFDSVITAIGLANQIPVMIIAIVIAVIVMMLAAGTINDFIDAHPTLKVLALSFLILIGVALIGEGLDLHIPKGYVYFAMAFSVCVEMLNMRLRARVRPVRLHKTIVEDER